jgi:hypothetical protein
MKDSSKMSAGGNGLASKSPPIVPGDKFPYKPLSRNVDSIRLIILKPRGEKEDASVVRCKLSHVTFGEKPQYEALSYTWGDPNDLKDIIIDGLEMKVRVNLYSALRDLRTEKPRVLWADAICIDQSNFQERTYQVGLMDYIYTRASCVLVWLGEFHQSSGRVVDDRVHRASAFGPEHRNFLELLVEHKYWTRLWVIQEVAHSMNLKVCVGFFSFDWREFMRRILKEFSGNHGNVLLIKQLDSKRRGRHTQSNRLEVLMEDFQNAQCTEPRDKVYGFLGMAHDCQEGIIEANYTKPLSDLYADVMVFFCRRRKFQNGASNDLDRSMRVVRFSQLVQKLLGGVTYAKPMNASSSQAVLTHTSQMVQTRAAIIGEILDIGPTYQEMISSSSANKRWRLSFEKWYSLPSRIQTLREANESYSLVLLDMTDQELAKIRSIHPCDLYTKGIIAKSTWNSNARTWDHQEPDNQTGRDTDDIPSNAILPDLTLVKEPEGPHMFLGNNCLMGLVPFRTAPGDKICQFWNSDVVVLLRKEKDSSLYRVIGRLHLSRCYLKDLNPMYGEADESDTDDIPRRSSDPDIARLATALQTMIIQMDIGALSVLTF